MRLLPLVLLLIVSTAGAEPELLDPVRDHLVERQALLETVDDPVEKADLLLETGWHEQAAATIPKLLAAGDEGLRAATEILLAVNDFERLPALVDQIDPETTSHRELLYEWLFTTRDMCSVEDLVEYSLERDSTSVTDLLAAARFQRAILNHDDAKLLYERALSLSTSAVDSAAAYDGLSRVAYKKKDFVGGLELLIKAIKLDPLDVDQLMMLGHTLIRLGRTDEAIDATELVVRLAPEHETGHYMLGNGYARKNYTQLWAAYPDAFADSLGVLALAHADYLLNAGFPEEAREAYLTIHSARPEWVDVLARIGSLDFSESKFAASRERFKEALAICPEYGRAHNGLAKAIEGQRFEVEVHRAGYEKVFAETEMPDVPRIEEFVLNWDSLSDRHKKRVALSIAPWARFLPALIAGEATYYIKPIYMLLSETPGQETLHDLRISSDARLWDDVRGCGGYNTVTGIEDVERTIFYRYDTVVHELTHQVHGVLPVPRARQLEELYRVTKERDVETGDAFLSRYAGSNVWEYFAEGVNALVSPRWDEYDTREVVRERLEEYDPPLIDLIDELMTEADIESCYAVAYVNLGWQSIEKARPSEANAVFRKALARTPDEENALSALVYGLQVADSTDAALEVARRAVEMHPESGDLATVLAGAMWHAGLPLADAVSYLRSVRDDIRDEEKDRIDMAMGRYYWILGDTEPSKDAYRAALEIRQEHPWALWGLASAHALAGEYEEAWENYTQAVRLRSGAGDLRGAFARDLLLAGEKELAREQIEEALLLDPDNPRSIAMSAWMLVEDGDPDSALAVAEKVLELTPWCDLAVLIKAKAERALGQDSFATETLRPWMERVDASAPPDYVYQPKWGRYEEVHTLPAVEQRIVEESAGEDHESSEEQESP